MMPILQPPSNFAVGPSPETRLPGVITPGQLGPMSVDLGYALSASLTRTMSLTGTPSVIAQITRMPAAAASRIASAAPAGGTKIMVASAPVACTACATVSKIGRPFASFWPPLPGVTPPTILVP